MVARMVLLMAAPAFDGCARSSCDTKYTVQVQACKVQAQVQVVSAM